MAPKGRANKPWRKYTSLRPKEKQSSPSSSIKVFTTMVLCFRHLLESHFFFGTLHRRNKFTNFYHDLMQNHLLWLPMHKILFLWLDFKKSNTVKPVLVVTSIKQPTCIKQPEESCPKIHRLIYLNCIKQPPAFSSHILSFPWVAA